MKNIVLILLAVGLGSANISYSQTTQTNTTNTAATTKVFDKVDQMPKPTFDLSQYLSTNIHYPEKARKHKEQGKVLVKFVVDVDGSITDITIKQGVSKHLYKEATRVVKQMPKWTPGIKDGVPVKVFFTLPINFKLNT